MKRIFSGVQPTGNLHLGNYLGAIRNWVRLQDEFDDCLFCVVDLHAITVWQEPKDLVANIREVAAAMMAAGIDPARNVIFNQSQVSAHAELAWIFNCVARLGWLDRMTQFKEKAGKDKERASVGLYAYPNLMAADILAYKGTHVPVGEDQKQHLELARDIAQKFNHDYGQEFFPVVEPSDNSRINMTDDADGIARKIKKAKTDSEPLPSEVPGLNGRPEASNLVGIYAALADTDMDGVLGEFGGQGFGAFKPALADLAVAKLSPVQDQMRRLIDDKTYVESVLRCGAEKANDLATPILREVQDLVGFLRPSKGTKAI